MSPTTRRVAIYGRPRDIITAEATITVASGSLISDPTYGLQNLYDGNPATVAKFEDGGVILQYDWGAARRIDLFALPHHNLRKTLDVRVQVGDDVTFAAPAIDVALDRADDDLMGHRPSPFVDFTTHSGYSQTGWRYGRLVIPAGNSVGVQLGETVWLGQVWTFANGLQWGQRGVVRPFLESVQTEAGVVRAYRRLVKQRVYVTSTKASDDDFEALQALADDCGGRARSFFFCEHRDVTTDGGILALFSESTARRLMGAEEWFDATLVPLEIEEQSRGLPLP